MSYNNTGLKGGVSRRAKSAPLLKADPKSNKGLEMTNNSGIVKRSARNQQNELIKALNAFGLDVKKIEKKSEKTSRTSMLQTKINSLSSTLEKYNKELNKARDDLNALYEILEIWDNNNEFENFYDRKRNIFYKSKDELQKAIDKKLDLIRKKLLYNKNNEIEIMKQSGILDDYTLSKDINNMAARLGETTLSSISESRKYVI